MNVCLLIETYTQDFRNYAYQVPLIHGMAIHMEFGLTTILGKYHSSTLC